MALLCLSNDLTDLKARLARLLVGFDREGKPMTAQHLGATGAMAALLQDAILPNLVQTAEGGPAFVHGGPFGNIAHGCNSIIATRTALACADYVVTEAGFGFDLGRKNSLTSSAASRGSGPRRSCWSSQSRVTRPRRRPRRKGHRRSCKESTAGWRLADEHHAKACRSSVSRQ